jgi:hypothetical protein
MGERREGNKGMKGTEERKIGQGMKVMKEIISC